jgi:hypothetical protein
MASSSSQSHQTCSATDCRYLASESTPWTGRTSAACPGKRRSKCLTRLLISLALVRVYWQEDTTCPKQQCIHACRDTVSIHIGHKYRHYSLETGNIAHSSVEGWWRDQMKMRICVLWTDESRFLKLEQSTQTTYITGPTKTRFTRERERERASGTIDAK